MHLLIKGQYVCYSAIESVGVTKAGEKFNVCVRTIGGFEYNCSRNKEDGARNEMFKIRKAIDAGEKYEIEG